MSNLMMPATAVSISPATKPDLKAQVEPGKEGFSGHMERKLRAERNEKKDLLGVKKKADDNEERAKTVDSREGEDESLSAAELLQQLMADLREMVKEPDTDAGQWSFQLQGLGLLEKLAGEAGMGANELGDLNRQMEEDGSLSLADLFAALENNFQDLAQETKVTVPETALPFLETLLNRMGVAVDDLAAIAEKGVNGMGELDLAAYRNALEGIGQEEAGKDITLSDWEFEQMRDMLTAAGVSDDMLEKMFSEKVSLLQKALDGIRPDQGDSPVQLTLERLKDTLDQAIASVDNSRVVPNVAGFFDELGLVLGQAGFESSDVGWTPVVQDSLTAVYQELQKMVDLAKVKVEKVNETLSIDEGLTDQWLASEKPLGSVDFEKLDVEQFGQEISGLDDFVDGDENVDPGLLDDGGENGEDFAKILNANTTVKEDGTAQAREINTRLPVERAWQNHKGMQQVTVDQISQGVIRGLKNNEHQLTMTLYPKELGEVKVDMQVRGSQLAVTFVMDNSRVKEAMEGNMEDFKDNLEQRGFSLAECSVSVGQHDNSDDAGQRFESAWNRTTADRNRLHGTGGGVGEVEAIVSAEYTGAKGSSISLFV